MNTYNPCTNNLLQAIQCTQSYAQEYRPWKMPYMLTEAEKDESLEEVTGDIPSIIGPDEPFDPDTSPEIDPVVPQPEVPTPPAHPTIPPHTNEQDDSAAPTQIPPHISPIQ